MPVNVVTPMFFCRLRVFKKNASLEISKGLIGCSVHICSQSLPVGGGPFIVCSQAFLYTRHLCNRPTKLSGRFDGAQDDKDLDGDARWSKMIKLEYSCHIFRDQTHSSPRLKINAHFKEGAKINGRGFRKHHASSQPGKVHFALKFLLWWGSILFRRLLYPKC